MIPTIAEEASITIENLNDRSSCGYDNLSLSCNTNCLRNIVPLITGQKYLISHRNLPELNESSHNYTPIKKGSKTKANSNIPRPILPTSTEVFEKPLEPHLLLKKLNNSQ